jgi:hypothetical protein
VRAIAEAKIKTDKIDAGVLADLLRADLIPEALCPKEGDRRYQESIKAKDVLCKDKKYAREQAQDVFREVSQDKRRISEARNIYKTRHRIF